MIDLSASQAEMRQRQLTAPSQSEVKPTLPYYYTPAQVAEILQISTDSVIRHFSRFSGVLDIGAEENVRRHTTHKRVLRIPHDVLQKFLRESRVQ